jgi:uncharacterized membrane protein
MSYCAPIAKEYGITLEDTCKIIGALSNYGIKASQAGTTFRRILTNLADVDLIIMVAIIRDLFLITRVIIAVITFLVPVFITMMSVLMTIISALVTAVIAGVSFIISALMPVFTALLTAVGDGLCGEGNGKIRKVS